MSLEVPRREISNMCRLDNQDRCQSHAGVCDPEYRTQAWGSVLPQWTSHCTQNGFGNEFSHDSATDAHAWYFTMPEHFLSEPLPMHDSCLCAEWQGYVTLRIPSLALKTLHDTFRNPRLASPDLFALHSSSLFFGASRCYPATLCWWKSLTTGTCFTLIAPKSFEPEKVQCKDSGLTLCLVQIPAISTKY